MENDPFYRAPGKNSAGDMPEFVDGHHRVPAQRQERNGKQELVESLHSKNSGTATGFAFPTPFTTPGNAVKDDRQGGETRDDCTKSSPPATHLRRNRPERSNLGWLNLAAWMADAVVELPRITAWLAQKPGLHRCATEKLVFELKNGIRDLF